MAANGSLANHISSVKDSARGNSDDAAKRIKQQIAAHADELDAMKPVAKKTVWLPRNGDATTRKKWAVDYWLLQGTK